MINLIIPFLGFENILFHSIFLVKILYVFIISVMRPTYSAHLISLISSLMIYMTKNINHGIPQHIQLSHFTYLSPSSVRISFFSIYHLRDPTFKPSRMVEMFIIFIIIIFMLTITVSPLICRVLFSRGYFVLRKRVSFLYQV
jgi:hypothetical protein